MTGKKPPHQLPGPEVFLPEDEETAILVFGDPDPSNYFAPTDALPGSQEKVEILRKRAEQGMPLWHPSDRVDFSGWKGPLPDEIRPFEAY